MERLSQGVFDMSFETLLGASRGSGKIFIEGSYALYFQGVFVFNMSLKTLL